MQSYIEKRWYSKTPVWWLLPLSLLFWIISSSRKYLYKLGLFKSHKLPVPVIVVGNIGVGGAGKTPLILWFCDYLRQQGFTPGVISRGYGGSYENEVELLPDEPQASKYGDEPSLIKRRSNPVVAVAKQRYLAAEAVVSAGADIILCDDGLQHYALQRDIECVVIDAKRGLGNGFCLPAGPLRETAARLKSADIVISNGAESTFSSHVMRLEISLAVNLLTGEERPLVEFSKVSAIAGIGNPQRFFDALTAIGMTVQEAPYLDHHHYTIEELANFNSATAVLMTEKDAVKIKPLLDNVSGADKYWYVPAETSVNKQFEQAISVLLDGLRSTPTKRDTSSGI